MRRRDLLQASAVGAGALALPLDALAGVDGEVARLLARIDRRCARVAERLSPLREVFIAAIPLEEQGIYEHALGAILSTVVYGELSAVRPKRQSHPAIQARIADAAARIAVGLREVVGFLERIGPARWTELHESLFADRARLNGLLDRVMSEVSDAGLPPGAVRQLDGSARRLAFQMESQGSATALFELVEQFRRLEASVARSADPFEPVRAATPGALATELADGGQAPPDASAPEVDNHSRDVALGALLLGVGVVGAGLYVAASIATGGYLIWCVCISAPLLIGLVMVIMGGVLLLMEA